MLNKLTKYLLYTLIFSLGFGQLLRFEYFGLPIYLHDILIICILALQGLTLQEAPNPQTQKWEGQTLKVFLLGLALGWFSALLHYPITQLLTPSLYTLRLLAYLALYGVIRNTKYEIPQKYFILSGLITLLIGLIQYFFLPDMRIFHYLGWDDHLSRLTLPHFDPTFTAVMLGLFLLSLKQSQWFIGLMLIWSILLTYSRSVWVSLGLTLSYFMLKEKKFTYLIIGICLLIIPISLLPKRFGEGTNLLRTYSITSRLESDLTFIKKYKWDLLVGRGMNTLILDSAAADLPSHASGPNNSYLYLLLTSGILGLFGWGMFMWSLYVKSIHKPMLVFFFVASLFNNVMFYPFALLWVLLIEAKVPTAT